MKCPGALAIEQKKKKNKEVEMSKTKQHILGMTGFVSLIVSDNLNFIIIYSVLVCSLSIMNHCR